MGAMRMAKAALPYRKRAGASPFNDRGELLCDRCGLVARGWRLVRPDNCGTGGGWCLREPIDVLASWQRHGFTLTRPTEWAPATQRLR